MQKIQTEKVVAYNADAAQENEDEVNMIMNLTDHLEIPGIVNLFF